MDWTFLLIMVVVVIGLALLSTKGQRRENTMLAEWRAMELIDFLAMDVQSSDARWAVRGEDATVAKLEHRPQRVDGLLVGLSVNRVFRNAAGEYFYWLWGTDGTRFHKHITHVNARILLKDAYVPPPET